MRLPRDLSGDELARALGDLGYRVTRQTGEHHVTVPRHNSLRVGTLAGILADIALHHGLTREVLVERLFGR